MLSSRGTAPKAQVLTEDIFESLRSIAGKDESCISEWLRDTKALSDVGHGFEVEAVPLSVLTPNEPNTVPVWADAALPTDVVMHVSADPDALHELLARFFNDGIEAVVEGTTSEEYSVKAVAFLRYEPVHMEVSVYANGPQAVVVFKDTARKDVVLFRRVCVLAAEYLRSNSSFNVQSSIASSQGPLFDVDEFEDEFSFDDPDPWLQRIEPVLKDAWSSNTSMKETALATLAQWAASNPECRSAMASAMVARGDFMAAVAKALKADKSACTPHEFVLKACVEHICKSSDAKAVICLNTQNA